MLTSHFPLWHDNSIRLEEKHLDAVYFNVVSLGLNGIV